MSEKLPFITLMVVVSLFSGMLGSYAYSKISNPIDSLPTAPPILIYDTASIISDPEKLLQMSDIQLRDRTARISSNMQKLADNGFLVLDAEAVIRAPKNLYFVPNE